MDNTLIIVAAVLVLISAVTIKYVLQSWIISRTIRGAKRGDVQSMVRLADWLYRGRFVKMNQEMAFQYYKSAAEWGDRRAQYNTGKMYDVGEGVRKDYDMAKHYFTLSASQKFPSALSSLGTYYYYGKGTPVNYGKALSYFEQAAEYGFPEAIYNVAIMHAKGQGTELNIPRAWQILQRLPVSYFRDADKLAFRNAVREALKTQDQKSKDQ